MASGQLRDVFPEVEHRVLEEALAAGKGSIEAAVEYLLTSPLGVHGVSCVPAQLPQGTIVVPAARTDISNRRLVAKAADSDQSPCTVFAETKPDRLREMFPEIATDILAEELEKSGGDIEAAATQLLERSAPAALGRLPNESETLMTPSATMKATVVANGTKRRRLETSQPRNSEPPKPAEKEAPGVDRRLALPSDVEFPLARVPVPLSCTAPGAIAFSWASLKTKTALQGSNVGPPAGSTWLWFLVTELFAHRVVSEDGSIMDVRMVGDKFQAGWVSNPKQNTAASVLRTRHHSMLQSMLEGTSNDYGSERGGTPVGFSHSWKYSDSTWARGSGEFGFPTSAARWAEVKGKDRWRVNINMRWHGAVGCVEEGRYLLVADQRAEKLNPNQYATAMRGAMVRIDNDAEGQAALQEMIRLYGSSVATASAGGGGGQGGLDRWLKKQSSAKSGSPQLTDAPVEDTSPEKQ